MAEVRRKCFGVNPAWFEKVDRRRESFTIVVEWTGEYINTSSMIEKVSRKAFCGSGMCIRPIRGKLLRDASFSVKSKAAVSRIMSGVENAFSASTERVTLRSISVSKCISGPKGGKHLDALEALYGKPVSFRIPRATKKKTTKKK